MLFFLQVKIIRPIASDFISSYCILLITKWKTELLTGDVRVPLYCVAHFRTILYSISNLLKIKISTINNMN
jgi:hypothetical protein